MNSQGRYDAVALFSGGLDSILAARLIQDQGLTVKCLHFVSPFFGKADNIPRWQREYGLDITAVDIGDAFVAMLAARPQYGFGKVCNPCVDCKILMMQHAARIMHTLGADLIVSGEVLGQRPMSQRKDTLNIIRRDAGVRDVLLRPLSAQLLDETPAEAAGKVDRSRLGAISGRGRKEQLVLAAALNITDIPTPAGGCRLAEKETGRSYWPVLRHTVSPDANDFHLANTGRQYWQTNGPTDPPLHLCIGRNQADNARLLQLARPGDIVFKIVSFPGPIALARPFPGQVWREEDRTSAAAFIASFSPKAAAFAATTGHRVRVKVHTGPAYASVLSVAEEAAIPCREISPVKDGTWHEYSWEQAREEMRAESKKRTAQPPDQAS